MLMVAFIKRYKWRLFGAMALAGILLLFQQWRLAREHSQDEVILAAAEQHRVPPALVKAVVWKESRFNPEARGRSGEFGLMQIMPDTAHDWVAAERIQSFTNTHLFDPAKNTRCGAWYLSRLLNRYRRTDNPLPYALAAYNAGPGNVAKWATGSASTNAATFIEKIGFPGTRDYVRSVSKRFEHYQRSFPSKQPKAA
jgi:soluble lytic murein transglycosylase